MHAFRLFREPRLMHFAEVPGERIPPPALSPESIDPSGILSGMSERMRGNPEKLIAERSALRSRTITSTVKNYNDLRRQNERDSRDHPGAKQQLGPGPNFERTLQKHQITLALEWLTLKQERLVAVNYQDSTWGDVFIDAGNARIVLATGEGTASRTGAPSPEPRISGMEMEFVIRHGENDPQPKRITILMNRRELIDIGGDLISVDNNPDKAGRPDAELAETIIRQPLAGNGNFRSIVEQRVLKAAYGSQMRFLVNRPR